MANFDIASFNLINWANATPDLYDSVPKNVEIVQKDANGNLFTKSIANRGMFKQQLWDDVGGALGQFNRTFYVDVINGDDNNTGTSDAPFKTLNKAVDSVPTGGRGIIFLQSDVTIEQDIFGYYKVVNIQLQNYTLSNSSFINSANKTQTTGFRLSASFVLLQGGTIQTADLATDSSGNAVAADIWTGFFRRQDAMPNIVKTYNVDIKIGDTPFIRRASGSSNIDLYMFDGSIDCVGTNNDSYLIQNEDGDFRFSSHGTTLGTKNDGSTSLAWSDLITGIVKDANGVPRNIISNIVF